MAKEIYKSGNYIVTVDADDNSRLFPIGKTVYDEYNSVFRLTEGLIEDDQLVISYADSTNWVDDSASAYTEATLRTFLRENTGFRPASGGSGAAPVGATPLKTNQQISYLTGDDGDLQTGRQVDFLTLPSANPFGTTERFTDVLGGQTYTDKIAIDWTTYDGSTVLGFGQNSGNPKVNWNTSVTNAASHSVGSYTSGWRLPNVNEVFHLFDYNQSYLLYYPPFNTTMGWTFVFEFWLSTTKASSTGTAFQIFLTDGIVSSTKTNTKQWFPVRTFTVNGTTLT